ncbi:MAG: RES family NAD+ phosphorylase [Chitinophagaceae bacterium]|nr:RES family NAD+ phosphorylase [Chitinophagaceae bacterium]
MIVYRIAKEEYSKALKASGYAARWNSKGAYVIYTAESRSLACLESLVHRSGEGNNALYKVMLIKIPDTLKMDSIEESRLKKGWQKIENVFYTQAIGTDWLSTGKSCILKVPSVIIKNEVNYILNPQHPDFKKIKLTGTEDFIFDARF